MTYEELRHRFCSILGLGFAEAFLIGSSFDAIVYGQFDDENREVVSAGGQIFSRINRAPHLEKNRLPPD